MALLTIKCPSCGTEGRISFVNPDYELMAKSFHIEYARIEDTDDINRAFKHLDFQHGCNLIEIMIGKDAFPEYSSKR